MLWDDFWDFGCQKVIEILPWTPQKWAHHQKAPKVVQSPAPELPKATKMEPKDTKITPQGPQNGGKMNAMNCTTKKKHLQFRDPKSCRQRRGGGSSRDDNRSANHASRMITLPQILWDCSFFNQLITAREIVVYGGLCNDSYIYIYMFQGKMYNGDSSKGKSVNDIWTWKVEHQTHICLLVACFKGNPFCCMWTPDMIPRSIRPVRYQHFGLNMQEMASIEHQSIGCKHKYKTIVTSSNVHSAHSM